MAPSFSFPQLLLLLLCSALLFLSSTVKSSSKLCDVPPVIFDFGDSNSDTGGLVAGLGFNLTLPYGRTFFHGPAGRFSDGRLIIDFLCQSVNTGFLNPYLDSTASTFSNGVNFAIAGSSILPRNVPFSLHIQLMQFLRFKHRSAELARTGNSLHFVGPEGFSNGVYVIDMGQNDLADSFSQNLSLVQVLKRIPSIILEIKNAIQAIHAQGGRNFWVHNTGPFGCLPQKLSLSQNHSSDDLDRHGCLSGYNAAARSFNEALLHLCQDLRAEMMDATIVYVDIYSIKYDMIANYTKYGFSNPLMACCGYGGPPYSQVCSEGSQYISWDGIHYTEAANRIIATNPLCFTISYTSSSGHPLPFCPLPFLADTQLLRLLGEHSLAATHLFASHTYFKVGLDYTNCKRFLVFRSNSHIDLLFHCPRLGFIYSCIIHTSSNWLVGKIWCAYERRLSCGVVGNDVVFAASPPLRLGRRSSYPGRGRTPRHHPLRP